MLLYTLRTTGYTYVVKPQQASKMVSSFCPVSASAPEGPQRMCGDRAPVPAETAGDRRRRRSEGRAAAAHFSNAPWRRSSRVAGLETGQRESDAEGLNAGKPVRRSRAARVCVHNADPLLPPARPLFTLFLSRLFPLSSLPSSPLAAAAETCWNLPPGRGRAAAPSTLASTTMCLMTSTPRR
jgi:hypothetical protein